MLWPKNLPTWPKQLTSSLPVYHSFIPLPPGVNGKWKFSNSHRSRSRRESNKGLLQKQEEKLKNDWRIITTLFPNASYEKYTYHWLIVNTRSFYYDLLQSGNTSSREDRMVLCPFVDYFNHADHGVSVVNRANANMLIFQCEVAFDKKGFTVTSDKEYGQSTPITIILSATSLIVSSSW